MLNTFDFDTYHTQFTTLGQVYASLEAFDATVEQLSDVVESWTPQHHELLAKAITPLVKPIGATGFDILPSYESSVNLTVSMEAVEEAKEKIREQQTGLMSKMFGALKKVGSHLTDGRAALARKHKELSYMGKKVVEVKGGVYTELLGPVSDDYNIFRYVDMLKRIVDMLANPETRKHRSGGDSALAQAYSALLEYCGGSFHKIRYKDHRGFKGPFMTVYKDLVAAIDKLEDIRLEEVIAKEEKFYNALMGSASSEEQNALMKEGSKQLKQLRDIYTQIYKILLSVTISSEVEHKDHYYHEHYNS